MSDEPRFVAKTNKYIPVESDKKSIFPSLDTFKHIKQVAPNIPTINLSSINAAQLKDNLQKLLNDKSLTTNTFIFTSKRYTQKLELERNRVETLLGIIDRVIQTNRNIINYNVDIFLTQQRLEEIALHHAVDMEKYARAILREEELLARQHEDNLDTVDDAAVERKAKIRAIQIANDKVIAEIDQMKAMTRITNSQADLLDRIKTELNLSNITSSQAFILVKALDPKASADTDFAAREAMINADIDRMKAETAKAAAQAEQEKIKTEHQDWKNKRERDRPRE